MWIKISLIFGFLILCIAYLRFIYKSGKKAEKLERLKQEIKARAKADEIVSNVINLNHDELNDRMHAKREASKRSMSTKN